MPTNQARTRTPYDLSLTAGTQTRDFMLAKDPNDQSLLYKPGLLPEIADAFRNDAFSYDHRDPRMDITAAFEDYSLGAGFEDAPAEEGSDFAYRVPISGFRGYNYTRGVNLSRGTRGYISDDLRPAGLALDATPSKIVLTALGLLTFTTRYIYRWSGTSWVQVFDDGAGGHIYDLFEFSNATATYVVAATRSAAYHYTSDGITWTASEANGSAPAFRSTATTSTSGATSLTPSEPTSAASNDILIYTIYTASDTVTVTPHVLTDWNLLATLGTTGLGSGRIYWCRRGGSAPNYQMDFGSSVAAVCAVSAYSGCKTTGTPIEGLSAITNTSGVLTFTFTGADQTFVVPAGVTSLTVGLNGAGSDSAAGGLVAGTLAVTPGETLHIQVGGTAGYNGGGANGGAGASDIRQGGTDLASRVAVAGGAGGTGTSASTGEAGGAGGQGGAGTGQDGSAGTGTFGSGGTAGTGGTSSAGGTTGGALGLGGDGQPGTGAPTGSTGGGGGGGYYGGGGGGGAAGGFDGDDVPHANGGGGGGGGSNYVGGLTSTTSTRGAGAAIGVNGSVTLTWAGATFTSPTVAAVTTLGANRMVIGVLASKSNAGDTTAPGGTTERTDVNGSSGSIENYEISAVAASVYGPYTATFTNGVGYSSAGFALLGVDTTGASEVTRWAGRGQASGAPVLWAINKHGSIRNATLVNTPSNWSGADAVQVGQRDATQLGLEVLNNVFFLVHRGGITSYDGTTVNTVFLSPFADPPSNAARPVLGLDGHLFFTFGSALLHLDDTNNTIEKVWPKGPQDGNAELNGTITAMTVNEKFVWFALKNSAGNTYIMQLDHSFTATVGADTITPAHTVAYLGANDVSAMAYLKASSNSVSSTNPVLALATASAVKYYILPQPGLRPEDDSACRFDLTADRQVVGSYVNLRAQSFEKWLTRGDIVAETTATETVKLQYRIAGGSAADIVTANTVQDGSTTAVLSTPQAFTRIRYEALLNTGGVTTSPVLHGVTLHAAPNAPRDRGFIFTVNIMDNQPTNAEGVKSRWKAADLDEFLFGAVNQLVTLRDIFGNTYMTKVLDVAPVVVRYKSDGSVEEQLTVTLGQLIS